VHKRRRACEAWGHRSIGALLAPQSLGARPARASMPSRTASRRGPRPRPRSAGPHTARPRFRQRTCSSARAGFADARCRATSRRR